jgi:uncharacterized protein YkwD
MRFPWLALLVACGSVSRAQMIADVESGPQRAVLAAPIVFGPIAHPAAMYNEPAADVPSTEARDQLIAGLFETAREKGEPVRDGRLDLVAGELADLLARGGMADDDLQEFALHSHGIPEAIHTLLVSHATTADAALAELTPRLYDALRVGNVHAGVGGGDGVPFVVVIVHTSLVTLPPTVPRELPAHGSFTFTAPVDASMHAPRITVTYDDDRRAREHPELAVVDRITFSATISCGTHTGNLWLSIEANDAKNVVQRLLLVPVSCAEPLETSYRIEPRTNTNIGATPIELAHRLAAIINRERVAANVQILGGDLRADNAARDATTLMRRNRSVEHDQASTTTVTRLRDQGLVAPFTLEATLHAKDLATAAEILLNRGGYRELLSRPEPTHLGISVAYDDSHELYIAIELVSIVPPIDTARLEAAMLERIAKLRTERERRLPLVRNKLLDRIAAKYVRDRVLGWSDTTVTDATRDNTELAFGPFGFTWRALTLLLTDDIDKVDLGPGKPFAGVGIAALQAPRNGALAGRTFVIVLYGKAR